MEAIPLCFLFKKKTRLFSTTQHRFIAINLIALTRVLHVSTCTLAILRHVSMIRQHTLIHRFFYERIKCPSLLMSVNYHVTEILFLPMICKLRVTRRT